MNRSKILLLSLIVMLTGCAANTDETSSVTTAVTTTTAAVTTTTTAATTQAATTTAQTTAVTEQSEPAETTAATTTVATTTASSTTTAETEVTVTPPAVETVEADISVPETAERTTPDGKYTIVPTDIINEDGTYTQVFGSGDTDDVSVPAFCTEHNSAWDVESASDPDHRLLSWREKSNPSQIPYSQITLENAHEAFPYMGFTGQHPGYIEILSSDSPGMIAMKVWNNLVGNDSLAPGRNYEGHGYGYMPEHVFSSEAEYNAWVADQKAQADSQNAAVDAGRAEEGGVFPETPEEIQDILAGW